MKKITERLLWGIRLICSVSAVVFSLIQLLGIWDNAVDVAVPLLGVMFLAHGAQEWKVHKKTAVFCLCTAIVIFVISSVVWFLK